jgi:hypothetical protein
VSIGGEEGKEHGEAGRHRRWDEHGLGVRGVPRTEEGLRRLMQQDDRTKCDRGGRAPLFQAYGSRIWQGWGHATEEILHRAWGDAMVAAGEFVGWSGAFAVLRGSSFF